MAPLTEERVLVSGGDNLELLGAGVIAEPAPAGALNARSGGVELLDEGVERTPLLVDRVGERARLELATVALALLSRAGKVLPEEGVVDVSFGREGEQR